MYLSGSRSCSCSMMSCRTRRVALAVNAAIGQRGKCRRSRLSCRYSGRNSWPHSDMQCASSIAKNEIGTRCSHSSVSSRASRSGERYSSRYCPSRASRITFDCCDCAQRAIQHRRRNSHLRQLRRLILHQRDQRRNHDHGLSRQHRRRQLVAERFPAAGRHHHARVAASEQAAHDSLLHRTERVVSPVAPQRRQKFCFGDHAISIDGASAVFDPRVGYGASRNLLVARCRLSLARV